MLVSRFGIRASSGAERAPPELLERVWARFGMAIATVRRGDLECSAAGDLDTSSMAPNSAV
eukprot:9863855-Alexandrium_andersonii.AAC.1